MATRGERFMVCPECTRRGVYLKMKGMVDVYRCRACDWYAYPDAGDSIDRQNMMRLATSNPNDVWVRR